MDRPLLVKGDDQSLPNPFPWLWLETWRAGASKKGSLGWQTGCLGLSTHVTVTQANFHQNFSKCYSRVRSRQRKGLFLPEQRMFRFERRLIQMRNSARDPLSCPSSMFDDHMCAQILSTSWGRALSTWSNTNKTVRTTVL